MFSVTETVVFINSEAIFLVDQSVWMILLQPIISRFSMVGSSGFPDYSFPVFLWFPSLVNTSLQQCFYRNVDSDDNYNGKTTTPMNTTRTFSFTNIFTDYFQKVYLETMATQIRKKLLYMQVTHVTRQILFQFSNLNICMTRKTDTVRPVLNN